jgi:type 1 glutamine amidotransferase
MLTSPRQERPRPNLPSQRGKSQRAAGWEEAGFAIFRLRALSSLLVLLLGLSPVGAQEAKKKLLLIGQGPDDHPATTHEYMAGLRVLAKCLSPVRDIEVTTARADGPWKEGPELIDRADGVVLFVSEGAKWTTTDAKRHEALARLAKRGGGIVVLHWAMGTREAGPITEFVKLAGACHGGPDRKYGVFETTAEIADPKHAISVGMSAFTVKDEFYYRLKLAQPEKNVTPLLRVSINGEKEMVAWCWERPDKGRSFGFSGLHFHANWKLPEYRRLVSQGTLWTLKLPIPRDGLAVEVTEGDLKLN